MRKKLLFIIFFIIINLFIILSLNSEASTNFAGFKKIMDEEDFSHYTIITGSSTDNCYLLLSTMDLYRYYDKSSLHVASGDNNFFKMYKLNDYNNWELYLEGTNKGIGFKEILYSNYNIYYWEDKNNLYLEMNPFYLFYNLNYVEEENYVQFSSQFFDYDNINEISISVSKDNINFREMEIGIADITNEFEYYYNFYQNGTYYIKYSNSITGVYEEFSIEITDIVTYSINFFLSTEDKTTEPIYILSNQYYYAGDYDASKDFLNNYDIDIAYGLEGPYNFSPFLKQCTEVNDNNENLTYTQYQYKIVVNGIYKLRILNLNTGEITYQTFNVTNISIDNPYGEDVEYNNYDEEGNFNPTPVLFLEYVDTSTVRIRTQPFTFNELMYLECYFSADGESYEKVNNIYKYSVDTGNSNYDYNTGLKQNILDLYYFYYDVKSDGTYYFKFYNIDLDTYTVGSIDVDISQFLIDNVDNIDKYPDRFVIWAEAHFGIIVYPIRFTLNFFGRLLTINYSEPILSIPELHEPFSNYKILDEVNFNFNSLLENNNIKIIHDLYLIIIDVIIIYMLIRLAGDIFEEVFKE